jgi:hypothetical protein
MKGSLGFFRVTLCGGKDCWPRRTNQAGRVPPLTQGGMRRAVVGLVQCSLAIVLTPMALGLAERLICGSATFRDGDERQRERSHVAQRRQRARDRSSAEHATLRRALTHGPTQNRHRARRGETMKTILCPVSAGFNFTA